MLALPQRRQHMPHHHHLSTSTTTTTTPSTSTSLLPSPLSPHTYTLSQQQQYVDQKLLNDYLDSQQSSFNPAVIIDANSSNPFMPGVYDFANPQIRIQQSTPTPTPQINTSFSSPSPMLSTQSASSGLQNWNSSYNQSLQTPQSRAAAAAAAAAAARNHQRASSQSSIGSGYQTAFSNVSNNHLPTPTHTPTQDSFMNHSNFSSYTPQTSSMDPAMAAHMSMKQALMDQHVTDEEAPGFAHSARHSVSSYGHDSPATPHTAQGDEADFKMPPSDMRSMLHRTYTDVAADYAFDPNTVVAQTQPTAMPQKSTANTLLSPYRASNANDIVQRSLQAAQNARSQSPSSSASRSDSPFRRGSPYRQSTSSFQSPRMAVGTASAAREQKAEADAAYAMKSQRSQPDDAQVKTISPKDALLDYREADPDSKVPLFPDGGASEYDHQYNGGDQYRTATQSTFDTASQTFSRDNNWATPQFSPNFSTSVTGVSQPPTTTFAFATPSIQAASIQGIPFSSTSQYRSVPQQMASTTDQNPEFPAHLTSMESSCSEMEPSSQSSDRLQKPADSKADSGTYTCTYHGCTQRFETPQKLQKHKREGHRNAANIGMGSSSSMTSAALLERNSQAGPHKCERINPTTGKPCNTIFSRPYDLTRHEDTIHNVRKQKVRCALCVEEKTFSRNDALTRHMRVVHPEVDFPGKHRRRGGNHD